MQRHFDEELKELKNQLLHMGGLAEEMAASAMKGLVERKDLSVLIFQYEQKVNDLQIEVDEKVVRLIALHHPVASDLRFLIMASKIGGELERIADQAVNISQSTSHYLQQPPLKPLVDLPRMAEIAGNMLRESLDAFTNADVGLAQKVLDTDDQVDAYKDQILRELLTYMMSDPTTIPRAIALILISRNLEKIGDHATNIAEEAIYQAQGREVRHHREELKCEDENSENN